MPIISIRKFAKLAKLNESTIRYNIKKKILKTTSRVVQGIDTQELIALKAYQEQVFPLVRHIHPPRPKKTLTHLKVNPYPRAATTQQHTP